MAPSWSSGVDTVIGLPLEGPGRAGRLGRGRDAGAVAEAAHRVRKMLGGGMRQAGILAAAGLFALATMVERLAEDHANARLLAAALSGRAGVRPAPVETNIVVAELERRAAPDVVASLRARGVLGTAMDARTIRFVTHRDVDRDACARAAAEIERELG